MRRNFSWFEPKPRNLPVDQRRLRIWRRWGKKYRHTRQYELLKEIEAARQHVDFHELGDRSIYWLLPYRAQFRLIFARFRQLCHQSDVEAVSYYMAFCPREMIPVCVWLIGKCADRFRLYGVHELRRDPSPQIRKHVAKTLRRLEAWALVEEMATLYPEDATIQRFARSPVPHRPFRERLSNYMRIVDDSHAGEVATPSRMPYWALEGTWSYTPPKSALFIRRMLRRIRHWVRWGVTSSTSE